MHKLRKIEDSENESCLHFCKPYIVGSNGCGNIIRITEAEADSYSICYGLIKMIGNTVCSNQCGIKCARTYCIINEWHQTAAKECNRKL